LSAPSGVSTVSRFPKAGGCGAPLVDSRPWEWERGGRLRTLLVLPLPLPLVGSAPAPAAPAPALPTRRAATGSCAALTGPASFLGTQTVQGAQTYVQSVNEHGGVHGRKIKVVSHDDGYEPAKAIECFNTLKQTNVFAAGFFVGTPTGAKHIVM